MTEQCVLIVDDDLDIRESLAAILQSEGIDAVGCGDGSEALIKLREGLPVALIILDMLMPQMGGEEFLARKAEDPDLVDIPVVVITAADRRTNKPVAAQLAKPIDVDQLLGMVKFTMSLFP